MTRLLVALPSPAGDPAICCGRLVQKLLAAGALIWVSDNVINGVHPNQGVGEKNLRLSYWVAKGGPAICNPKPHPPICLQNGGETIS